MRTSVQNAIRSHRYLVSQFSFLPFLPSFHPSSTSLTLSILPFILTFLDFLHSFFPWHPSSFSSLFFVFYFQPTNFPLISIPFTVNGSLVELLDDVKYLLSPQDLMAIDFVPELVVAGMYLGSREMYSMYAHIHMCWNNRCLRGI